MKAQDQLQLQGLLVLSQLGVSPPLQQQQQVLQVLRVLRFAGQSSCSVQQQAPPEVITEGRQHESQPVTPAPLLKLPPQLLSLPRQPLLLLPQQLQ
jgi:hypothetical protein